MQHTELTIILDNIHRYKENERLEFKTNFADAEKIAETICSLSNASCIKKEPFAYMIWGVDDKKTIIGTQLNPVTHKVTGKNKSQGANLWQLLLNRFKSQITLELIEQEYKGVVIRAIKIQAAHGNKPVLYNKVAYIRISAGDDAYNDNLINHSELLTQILHSSIDNTAGLTHLTINDLDLQAITKLKTILFSNPNNYRLELHSDEELMRKLGILKDGYITYGGILLLGKEINASDLFSDKGQITWKYEDIQNNIVERRTRTIPLIMSFEEIIHEIQRFNTTITDTTLFRKDLRKYETKALRELLFNAIVHRDWTINQRVEIIQTPQSIKFINPGLFIAILDDVLRANKRPEYRNPHLSSIFKACGFIEKEGGGLRDVYKLQLKKGLSVTSLFERTRTVFELLGYIKDVSFAKAVEKHTFSDVYDLVLLDKIVNNNNSIGDDILKEDAERLKQLGYIELSGTRYQKANLAKDFAKRIKKDGVRTRIKGLDTNRYEQLIIQHLQEHNFARFDDIKEICKGKKDQRCSTLMLKMKEKGLVVHEKIKGKRREDWLYYLPK